MGVLSDPLIPNPEFPGFPEKIRLGLHCLLTVRGGTIITEAVFLVMCGPSMNEL